ncbi:hypothetical protein [Marixanthomonas ophiurae]|uniref:Uncharacterized protein n=1 Tax=Marixanthomonas ophiurae TaxID=387659 RepID=A0A3E1Q800_9FLAO|nr:hypothetical protein [Marixanthomonas ophiurae]RFN58256.1 hypothetical protein DZ858_13600 [Marixanthomonas ophiurae]
MKTIKILTIILCSSLFIYSCSDDDSVSDDDGPSEDSRAELYASSNTNGNPTMYDLSDQSNIETKTFLTLSTDAEGIYYDEDEDQLTQASRSMLKLNTYGDISVTEDGINLDLVLESSADLESPRDIAVNGDIFVVSDNADVDGDPNTDDGRFFVYTKTASGFTLRNTVEIGFAVWGIEFVGNDLFAVVDKTSDIAQFSDFSNVTTNTTVAPTKQITVEGIVRTHGIGFDDGTMILTDIGDAAVDSDGGFHIISNFQSKFNGVADGETLVVADNQIRVSGGSTFLGNPVSADYDADSDTVFIAERANGGGRVLAFVDASEGGNISPDINNELSGASSVYYYSE